MLNLNNPFIVIVFSNQPSISLIYLCSFEKIIILSSVALLSDLIIDILIWFRLDIELKDMMQYTFPNMFTQN